MPPPTLAEQVRRHADRETTVVETVSALYDRIETHDGDVHAFMATDRRAAMRRADELDQLLARGEQPGPLHGIAVAVKDSMDVAGWVSTSGSIVRADYRAERTAHCVRVLQEAGAVVIGKTMMDEWAFGGSTENPHFGRVANPWDPERTTGGSSGGSAAAVAAGFAPLALGTDTGGSVRLPAALCGVVGFKPTLGRLPLEGIEPLAPTYDTLGVFAHYVEDTSLWLAVLEGDPATPPGPPETALDPLTILYPDDLPPTDAEILQTFEQSLARCVDAGVEVRPASLPWLWDIPAHFRPVVLRELAAAHSGPAGDQVERYGRPLQESIAEGLRIRQQTYEHALAFRDDVRRRFDHQLAAGTPTLLATPMTARPADPQGVSFGDVVRWPDGTEEDYFAVSTRFTLFANVLGAPALSIPVLGPGAALPAGFQLVGLPGTDEHVLRVGAHLQQLFGGPVTAPMARR